MPDVNYEIVLLPLPFGHASQSPKCRRAQKQPPPVLPQMQTNAEFGGGECKVGMFISIYAQLEIVLPLFSARRSPRGANGGS